MHRISRAWPARVLASGELELLPGLNEEVAHRVAESVWLFGRCAPDGEFHTTPLETPFEGFTHHVCISTDDLQAPQHWLATLESE